MEQEKLVLPNCKTGIEIEIERSNSLLTKRSNWWLVKGDGSLRDGGHELVFIKPFSGKEVIEALEEAFFKLLNKKMQISPRTGIHVHLNASDMNVKEIHNLCVLYALSEEPLFKWVGNYRDSNQFCLPWYEAEGDIEHITKLCSSTRGVVSAAGRLHRYSALNLNAINKFHSVEFRHLQTTFDYDKVLTWINMAMCLKAKAVSHEGPASDLIAQYSKLGPEAFLKEVFKDFSKELDYTIINLGLMVAQELCAKTNAPGSGFYAHQFTKGVPEGYSKFKRK